MSYNAKIEKYQNVISPYVSNIDIDYQYERARNNFTPLIVENKNFDQYPWNLMKDRQFDFLYDSIEAGQMNLSTNYNDGTENIIAAHNKKLLAKQNIINGMDINKVRTFDNRRLKTTQEEFTQIRNSAVRLANIYKDEMGKKYK